MAGRKRLDLKTNGGAVIRDSQNVGSIDFYWADVNESIGGIVGQMVGSSSIITCTNYGTIRYASAKSDNKEIAPCMAQIVGSRNSPSSLNSNSCQGSVDSSNLQSGGILWWAYDQKAYVSSGECGKLID